MKGTTSKAVMAFIAVALMIMVAFVPAVSVLTDSGSDATSIGEETIIPKSEAITVSGTVKTGAGTVSGALVTVTGTGILEKAYTDAYGVYSVKVYTTGVTLLVAVNTTTENFGTTEAPIINPVYKQDYTPISIGIPESNVGNVNFESGKVLVSGELLFGNATATPMSTAIASGLSSALLTATYGPAGSTVTINNIAVSADGKFQFPIVKNAGNVTIKVSTSPTGYTFSADGFVTSVAASNVTATNVKADQHLLTITGESSTVTSVVIGAATAAESKVANITEINKTINDDGNAYWRFDLTGAGTDLSVKVSDTASHGSVVTMSDVTGNSVNYSTNRYFYGTVIMNGIAVNNATVAAQYKKADGTNAAATPASVQTDEKGAYKIWFGVVGSDVASVVITVTTADNMLKGTATVASFTSSTPGSLSNDFSLTYTAGAYYKVSGTVTSSLGNISGATITVSATGSETAYIFGGSTVTKVTASTPATIVADAYGAYSFMIEAGKTVTITPSVANDAKYVVSSYTQTFNADTPLNFVQKTKIVTGAAVTDAGTEKLEGIAVYYSTNGQDGPFSKLSTTTDANGIYKITVNSGVDTTKIFVYFADESSAKTYTFTASTPETSVVYTTAAKAIEKEFSGTLKDASGNLIKDTTGMTITVARYNVHYSAGTLIYTQLTSSVAVTLDGEGNFSFIANAAEAIATPPTSAATDVKLYAVEVKTTSSCQYTFGKTIFTANTGAFPVSAVEGIISGIVYELKESGSEKTLKGMNVDIYTMKDGKLDKKVNTTTAVTNGDGTFKVVAPAASASYFAVITDPNSDYTFEYQVTYASDAAVTKFYANEKAYSGTAKDMGVGTPLIEDTDTIGVAVYNGDDIVGSLAIVGEDGKFTIVTKLVEGYVIKTVDSSATRTFDNITITPGATAVNVSSNQAIYSGTISENGSTPAVKNASVSIYEKVHGDDVKIAETTTDKDGKYSFFLTAESKLDPAGIYNVFVKSTIGGYTYLETGTAFTSYVADIDANEKTVKVTVTDKTETTNDAILSGAKVDAFTVDGAVYTASGSYTADDKAQFTFYYKDGLIYAFKVVSADGKYTFGTTSVPYVSLASNKLVANEQTIVGGVTSKTFSGYSTALVGVTVTLKDADGKVIAKTVTDEKGEYSFIAEKISTNKVYASDGKYTYGAFTFSQDGQAVTASTPIDANEYVFYGFYANGMKIANATVYYSMSVDGVVVEYGNGTIIDAEYFIVTDCNVVVGNKMDVAVTATGFNASATLTLRAADGPYNLAQVLGGYVTVPTTLFNGYFQVIGASTAGVGDKVVLRAQNNAFEPLDSGNDVSVVKYVFAGWYVNGEKVSSDLEYVYTIQGPCNIYADYTVSSYDTVPDAPALSNTVIIIGVIAVIIALLAVAYVVIQSKKKDEKEE